MSAEHGSEFVSVLESIPVEGGADWPSRKVVVTGGAGFIGSHLVDRLLDDGFSVLAIDNFDPWYDPAQKQRNLLDARRHPRFQLCRSDLLTMPTEEIERIVGGAEVLFHLAGRPGVQDSWGPGFESGCALNVLVTQRLLEAAAAAGVGRVVLASSSSVYGGGAEVGRRAVSPISPYGVSKAASEQLAAVYGRLGLEVVALRYFTVFGPRQRPDMAFHRLFEALLGGPAFPRRGSGDQRREFTFVSDVVAATVAAGTAPSELVAGQTVDIGGGCVTSLREVMDLVGFIAGRRPRIEPSPSCPGDPAVTVAESAPAAELLGWRPSVSLPDGLDLQWRWHHTRAPGVPALGESALGGRALHGPVVDVRRSGSDGAAVAG